MDDLTRALDATDDFIHALIQDEGRLSDPKYMRYVMQLRQEHKRTLYFIEQLHDLQNEKIKDIEFIDDDLMRASRSRSARSLLHNSEWQEIRRVEVNEEWVPSQATLLQPSDIPKRERSVLRRRETYSERFIKSLMQQQREREKEEVERIKQLRFKAREVPPTTYEPLYQQMLDKQEKAKEERHRRAIEMLENLPRTPASSAPPSYHLRRCISAEASAWDKRGNVHVNDVPVTLYVPPYKDEIRAMLRARRKAERAANLIRTSKGPPGLEAHTAQAKLQHKLRHAKHDMNGETKQDTKRLRTVPDFKKLQENFLKKLEGAAQSRPTTTVAPFYFYTEQRVHMHKCNLEEPAAKITRRSLSMGNLRASDGPTVRLNQAAILRNEAIRIRAKKFEDERNQSKRFWESMKERHELARQRLRQKLLAEVNVLNGVRKRNDGKRRDRERSLKQYKEEMGAMEQRIRERALVLEQQQMLIERQRFERKFAEMMMRVNKIPPKITVQKNGGERQNGYGSRRSSMNSSAQGSTKVKEDDEAAYSTSTFTSNSEGEEQSEDEENEKSAISEAESSSEDKLSKISERSEKSSVS